MENQEVEKLKTPKELAEILNVAFSTVYNWIRKGDVEHTYFLGNIVFTEEQVETIKKKKLANSHER